MKKTIQILFFLVFASQSVYSQNSQSVNFYEKNIAYSDTLNKRRFTTVAVGTGATWLGTLVFLNSAWYSNYPKSKFHFYNDQGEWENMDKWGHVYSAYLGSKIFSTLFRWSGVKNEKALLYGAGGGFAYQSVIEVLDGYSAKWGFSWSDIGTNALGCGIYAGQELLWHEQRILPKFSFNIQDYGSVELLKRANDLYGQSNMERMLKDYNGQTYWYSLNIQSFMKQTKFPKWLNLAFGYGAQNMLGGYANTWIDQSNVFHNRTDIRRYRQFFISPDIDFSRLPIKNKFLKSAFRMINLKMPLPTIEFNTLGETKFHGVYW